MVEKEQDQATLPTRERIDLKIDFQCNNRCRFCVQGNKREHVKRKSTDALKAHIADGRKDCDSIVFTGGEASIHKDFIELVQYASEQGFRSIQIQSNGRMFSSMEFCRKVVDAGATEFSPALHGHVPELHDFLTRAEGSFRQTARGIKNMKQLGVRILTNSVITRSNYRHLEQLARVLVHLGADQYQFAFVHAVGTAGELFHSIVPRKSLIEPYVKYGLDVGIEAGVSVMTEAYPYCFMNGYEEYVAERIIPRTKIFDGDVVIEDYTDYRLREGKVKGAPCSKCTFNPVCEGPWREYPEKYGWDEFIPRKDKPGF